MCGLSCWAFKLITTFKKRCIWAGHVWSFQLILLGFEKKFGYKQSIGLGQLAKCGQWAWPIG